MRLARVGGILAVVLAAAALSACGSDSKSSGDSKADVVKQADAICTQVKKDLAAIPAPANIQDPTAVSKYFDKAVPVSQKAVDELKALKPSGDYKADYDAYVKAQGDQIDALTKIQAKAKAKDPSGLKDLQKLSDKTTGAAAKKAGLNACV
jgi:hypothetical protein